MNDEDGERADREFAQCVVGGVALAVLIFAFVIAGAIFALGLAK